jgi:hypothetical protein
LSLAKNTLETKLTPWNRVLLEKLIVTQMVKKFPATIFPENIIVIDPVVVLFLTNISAMK